MHSWLVITIPQLIETKFTAGVFIPCWPHVKGMKLPFFRLIFVISSRLRTRLVSLVHALSDGACAVTALYIAKDPSVKGMSC